MTSPDIARHFATIRSERQIHYRRAGSGPPVLLLHQSPASSAELIPLIKELSASHTVIAPDTPGNGLSDPLPLPHPGMDDYANNIVDLMDEIGLPRAAVYGFHSGAACAMALAHRHAGRIDVAIANGYTQMQPDELADILHHYLPVLTIEWNGAHLLWAWSRMREQFIFFPWYARKPATRLASGMPSTQALHDAVMDLMRAGNGYSQAYRAALEYDRAAVVSKIVAPTVIMTARTDALYRYLDAMPHPSVHVSVQRPADHVESRQLLRETLAAHNSNRTETTVAPTRPIDGTLWREYLHTPYGSLFALRSNTGGGRPLLFCHGPTGSALGIQNDMVPWVGQRPLLAVDIPGNGESDALTGNNVSVTQHAEWLADAVECAGFREIDILAPSGGAAAAVELTRLKPHLVNKLLLTPQQPQFFGCRIELDDYGLHLLRVWNIVRDQQLYSLWHTRKRANVRSPSAAALDPAHIHARVLDVLKCLNALPQIEATYAQYPLESAVSALGEKVVRPAAN